MDNRATEQLAVFYSHTFRGDWCRIIGLIRIMLLEDIIPEPYKQMMIECVERGEASEEELRGIIIMLGEHFDITPKDKTTKP